MKDTEGTTEASTTDKELIGRDFLKIFHLPLLQCVVLKN